MTCHITIVLWPTSLLMGDGGGRLLSSILCTGEGDGDSGGGDGDLGGGDGDLDGGVGD